MPQQISLDQLNALSEEEFQATIGPVFEKSGWVAKVMSNLRPFENLETLLQAMIAEVENGGPDVLLELIQAHPDLGARIHERDALTDESKQEQNQTGLFGMAPDEEDQFVALNQSYNAKFGFPFIICARMNTKESILDQFRLRLERERETEIAEAWAQIQKIAELRLNDILIPS